MFKKTFAPAVVAFATVAPAQAVTLTQWSCSAATTGSSHATSGTNRFDRVTVQVTAVPEPGSCALMLTGLAAIGRLVTRRRACARTPATCPPGQKPAAGTG